MGRASREKRLRSKGPHLREETSSPIRPLIVLCILFSLALLIYSNTFSVPFQFDDVGNIVDNPQLKGPVRLLDPSSTRYVGFLTFALNYRLDGLNVFGYHLINLLIHVANGLLVYSLVVLLFRTIRSSPPASARWIALAASLLFIAHPIQTQAVTYIVQRLASLMTLFYLLAVVCYLKWRLHPLPHPLPNPLSGPPPSRGRGRWWYVGALLSCVLAMKTKENSFTLPFMILLVEAVFFRPSGAKRWFPLLPFLLTLPIIPLSGGDALGEADRFARDATAISRLEYLFTQFRVIITYLRLLVFPINQTMDYDYPIYRSLFHPGVFPSFLLLSSLLGYALYVLVRPRPGVPNPLPRLIAFGILWFFLTLSIESSIIPITDVIFEHRLYLPAVGIFLIMGVAWGGAAWRQGGAATGPAAATFDSPRPVLWRIVGMGLVVVILGVATYRRNSVWGEDLTLWQDVVRKAPGKARGHHALGFLYRDRGRLEESIREYQAALSLQPNYTEAHNGLGVVYRDQGRLEESIREYQAALSIQPGYANAHTNLGVAYQDQGLLEEAIRAHQTALKIQPDNMRIHNNLGIAFVAQGRVEEAMREYQAALALRPDSAEAHYNLGIALAKQGRREESIREYQTALALKPDYAEARTGLGIVYKDQGRLDEAIREYQTALRLQPDNMQARNNLGSAFVAQGRAEEAIREYQAALKLKPDSAQVHYDLGIALAKQGRLEEAIREYQAALELEPDYAKARANLGTVYATQGRFKEASREFEAALKLQPDYAEAHNNLGNVYLLQGRVREATFRYREALRLKPDFEEARKNLDHAHSVHQ